NEHYWDSDEVILDQINFPIIADHNTQYRMYQNGELDWVGDPTGSIPFDSMQALENEGALYTETKAGTYYYQFNTEEEPFTNANIRKALSYAIDREAITDN